MPAVAPMMYGFGDDNPAPDTINVMEELLVEHIIDIVSPRKPTINFAGQPTRTESFLNYPPHSDPILAPHSLAFRSSLRRTCLGWGGLPV